MQAEVSSPLRKLLLTAALTVLLSLVSVQSRAQDDPPMQPGRISYVSGNVSIQPAGLDDWGQAQANLSFGPGDRIFTDSDGRAEIQIGESYIRIGPNSDVSMVEDTPTGISIGVAQGSVHIHTHGLWMGQRLYVNTPSGSAALEMPAELRVDVLPDQGAAVFTGLGAYALITGAGGFSQGIAQGQSLELAGSNPVVPQYLEPGAPDPLDIWSQQRDQQIFAAASWRYISPEIPGGEELDANGSWMPGTPYGAVWFPNVAPGWAPYHYGRWVNHAPWGPVWVEDESWGYAPFHYGRWVSFQGRWGWVPGPREGHPVWSPALVVFAGGIQVGGVAVSAWFPLGPGEPYRPWYPCSPRYVDQVNITNMAEGPRVHVLTTYAGFNFGGVGFAYRTTGITAIRQDDFAAGRPVRQANVVVNVNIIQHVTIIERPVVQVNERVIVERAPSRPVPVAAARPTLINEKGMVVSARPGFRPVAAPVRPAPLVHVLPGRQVVAPPPNSGQPGRGQFNGGQPGNNRPGYQPGANNAHPEQPVTQQPPVQQPQPDIPTGQRMHKPAAQPEEQPQQQPQPDIPTGQRMHKPAAQPEEQPTNNPPARNNNAAPGNGSSPQPGAKQGEKPGNEHGGKPEDKDKKDNKKDDKPQNK
ncbi:MAG: DUF6600 domain-containing protein [Terracidiphilus sp.]